MWFSSPNSWVATEGELAKFQTYEKSWEDKVEYLDDTILLWDPKRKGYVETALEPWVTHWFILRRMYIDLACQSDESLFYMMKKYPCFHLDMKYEKMVEYNRQGAFDIMRPVGML